MNDFVDAKKTKDRSPSFPFIDLETAIGRAKQIFDEEGRTPVPQLRVFMHWRYSDKSSGALQSIAALRSYGLLEEFGAGAGPLRQFKLTDLALRILLDKREDPTERDGYILKAALNPPIAAEVYAKWPDKLPQDSTINHHLVFDRKFTQSSANAATKILKENHIFAKVALFDSLSYVAKTGEDEDNESMEDVIDAPISQRREQPNVQSRAQAAGARVATPQLPEPELIRMPDGKMFTVQFSEVPDLAAYQMLKAFVDFKLLMFKPAKVTSPDNSTDDKSKTEPGAHQP